MLSKLKIRCDSSVGKALSGSVRRLGEDRDRFKGRADNPGDGELGLVAGRENAGVPGIEATLMSSSSELSESR